MLRTGSRDRSKRLWFCFHRRQRRNHMKTTQPVDCLCRRKPWVLQHDKRKPCSWPGWRSRGHQERLSRRCTPWVELVKERRSVGTVEKEGRAILSRGHSLSKPRYRSMTPWGTSGSSAWLVLTFRASVEAEVSLFSHAAWFDLILKLRGSH